MFQWHPDLALGVPTVDAQHQEIFRRINRLLEAARNGEGRKELADTLEFLTQYVVQHMAAEELIMIRAAYPDYAAHRQQHLEFMNQVFQLKLQFDREGASTDLVLKVQKELTGWLRIHIQKEDRKLASFMQGKAPATV
ncbi:MAG TPA: bacteriohemerythrin [Symbiobacteriaceae bacterium]|nr:bacteriohemerythrin [Symbiobacteriaceae bacterium]